ncbi:hypothetical protein KC906_01235 [Candidatus Kaiserbacteria bacterium]|nr:hypothetical protein [Candidatus Kaiserbacteria bacterium]MCB9812247.1 hypothetical protein [Candidatus Nomurabacteria bacterium]
MIVRKPNIVVPMSLAAVAIIALQGCAVVPVMAVAAFNEKQAKEAETYTVQSVKLRQRANWKQATTKELKTYGGLIKTDSGAENQWKCAASIDTASDDVLCIEVKHFSKLYQNTSFRCQKGTYLEKTFLGKEHRCSPETG